MSGAEVMSMLKFGAAAVFAGGHREPTDAEQAVETAAFVVEQLVTPSSPRGNHWLWAAVHTPQDPLSHWACFQRLGCPL